jgi:hypothetical protein
VNLLYDFPRDDVTVDDGLVGDDDDGPITLRQIS